MSKNKQFTVRTWPAHTQTHSQRTHTHNKRHYCSHTLRRGQRSRDSDSLSQTFRVPVSVFSVRSPQHNSHDIWKWNFHAEWWETNNGLIAGDVQGLAEWGAGRREGWRIDVKLESSLDSGEAWLLGGVVGPLIHLLIGCCLKFWQVAKRC